MSKTKYNNQKKSRNNVSFDKNIITRQHIYANYKNKILELQINERRIINA